MSPPLSKSTSTTPTWPAVAARIRGVKPVENRGNTKVYRLKKHETPIFDQNHQKGELSIVRNTVESPFHVSISLLHTFFVPVLNVGSSCNEDRHQLLVSSCTCQCQRCVVVTLRLWRKNKKSFLAGFRNLSM